MTWQEEWKAISARIEAQMVAGNFLVQVLQKNADDPNNSVGTLIGQIRDTNDSLKKFVDHYRSVLPPSVCKVLDTYDSNAEILNPAPGNPLFGLSPRLMRIQCLRSEVDYYLTDFTVLIKRLSERAFFHLQQCIIAASDISDRWLEAYNKDELSCEKLGAAHLLQHGIYAFKVNAEGGRTDLVFNEPIEARDVARVADAMVLTEWKLIRQPGEAKNKAKVARYQSTRYQSGVLGGIELTDYRYIVLVSEDWLDNMPDAIENGITNRHINIAVSPSMPSRAAAKRR
jgi:hypothetical protein